MNDELAAKRREAGRKGGKLSALSQKRNRIWREYQDGKLSVDEYDEQTAQVDREIERVQKDA